MTRALELLLDRDGQRVRLRSPEVGTFTHALPAGALLAGRARAGVLHSLGRRFDLIVPAGVSGRIVNARPDPVETPVGYGSVLYELAPLEAGEPQRTPNGAGPEAPAALVFRAPYSGRFWQAPSPGAPSFVKSGDLLSDGHTVGLIEVMKTFTHLVYRSTGELPPRARILRLLVPDGGEVKDGGALLELEPA